MITVKNNFTCGHNSVVYDTKFKRFYILKGSDRGWYVGVPFKITNNYSLEKAVQTYMNNQEYEEVVYVHDYDMLVEFWKSCVKHSIKIDDGLFGADVAFKTADEMLKIYMERLIS